MLVMSFSFLKLFSLLWMWCIVGYWLIFWLLISLKFVFGQIRQLVLGWMIDLDNFRKWLICFFLDRLNLMQCGLKLGWIMVIFWGLFLGVKVVYYIKEIIIGIRISVFSCSSGFWQFFFVWYLFQMFRLSIFVIYIYRLLLKILEQLYYCSRLGYFVKLLFSVSYGQVSFQLRWMYLKVSQQQIKVVYFSLGMIQCVVWNKSIGMVISRVLI